MESATNFNYMKELESIKKDLDGMKKGLEENKSNDLMQTKYEIGREYIFIRWFCLKDIYRVVINERHNVLHYCDPILSPGDFLSLLGAYQIWSIW